MDRKTTPNLKVQSTVPAINSLANRFILFIDSIPTDISGGTPATIFQFKMQIFSLNLQKFSLIFIFILNINGLFAGTPADSWIIFARRANKMFDKCLRDSESMGILWSCFKRNTLMLFDEISSADAIPLMDGVQLIRDPQSENSIWAR